MLNYNDNIVPNKNGVSICELFKMYKYRIHFTLRLKDK